MTRSQAIDRASELVKAALADGWLKDEGGQALGQHVTDAIEAIARGLLTLDDSLAR